MQKTVGLNRLVESGRATAARSQRNNYGFHLSSANYDGKIAGLYDLEETLGELTNRVSISSPFNFSFSTHDSNVAFVMLIQVGAISP